jgi:hypothetical protein
MFAFHRLIQPPSLGHWRGGGGVKEEWGGKKGEETIVKKATPYYWATKSAGLEEH